MCEFCTKHGEGKKWYLQMKNYAPELLHAELSASQQELVNANTRLEWNNQFWRGFVLPAITGTTNPSIGNGLHAENRKEGKVEHFGQVIPIEDVERAIDLSDSITRMPCGCRFESTGKTDRRYCFGFGIDRMGVLGQYPEATTGLEVLTRDEAKRIIYAFDRDGLFHSIWTGVTPYVLGICNCDQDCGAMRGYVEQNYPPYMFRGEYICQVDWELCDGCRECMHQCQFGAQFYSATNEKVYIAPVRCYGCGVCRSVCPNGAIELVPRQANRLAKNLWE